MIKYDIGGVLGSLKDNFFSIDVKGHALLDTLVVSSIIFEGDPHIIWGGQRIQFFIFKLIHFLLHLLLLVKLATVEAKRSLLK